MMKSIALSFFILTIFLGPPTAKGDVSFDLSTATKNSYTSFIRDLRSALPTRGTVCNIPVLPSTASGLQWFRFFSLTNYNYQTITVAVNVTNVYIAAYSTGAVSYFFEDTSAEAFRLLFVGTQKVTLPYSGNYDRLQSIVGKNRDLIELGIPTLSNAITNLFYNNNYKLTATALLVLIQSTAEAARFKYIEQEVSKHVSSNFFPNQAIISLENSWGALSKQIQIANSKGTGQFDKAVELITIDGKRVSVTNTSTGVVKSNIKLLLYYKVNGANDNYIPTILPLGAI
ncbi:type I ribosome-inactivating protein trichoanguina-like [Momordica charantia]|uniref:rRNA N-glycosylase n=1 Tax=Momordica charantia TaxID=3673 RepID=A0A6J1DUC7_MOMCH|nr:type I ribosome-inactivating protein trichoanguina-like [Momordica charantia]